MGIARWERNARNNLAGSKKTLHSWSKRSFCVPRGNNDGYLQHTFREHNQEADHLANLRTEGKVKTTEGVKHTEEWKAVRGCWDGGKTDGGRCQSRPQDEKWITIRKIAVPLKACSAMGGEIAGTSLSTGVLGLLLHNKNQLRERQRMHQ